MNILILGSGGREHSLAWAVMQNPKCDRLIVAPGNAGIARTCEVATLAIGQARYGLLLDERGGCIDDVMLTRVGEDEVFFCVNASNVDAAHGWIREHAGASVKVENRSRSTSLISSVPRL